MPSLNTCLVLCLLILSEAAAVAQGDDPGSRDALRTSFSRLPLYFMETRGLYSEEVAYVIQGSDKTLYFAGDGVTIRLKDRGQDRAWAVKLVFVDARSGVVPRGEDRQPAVFSYFKGPKKDWKVGLATFSRVVYHDLWPGIDLVYQGTVNQLKYEFVVHPGADPGRIRLRYEGATAVRITERGALVVETPAGGFEDAPPVAWQVVEGRRVPVAMAYGLSDDSSYGFNLGDYDTTRTLVLDPAVLVYCGFIGGVDGESGAGIAVDLAGNAYVTGHTLSDEQTFPVKAGPDLTYNGASTMGGDAFVAKVNAAGTALVYCGFIGGVDADSGSGIAVDASGNAYVTGTTWSAETTFPVKTGPDLTYNWGQGDAFVARVNASGTALDYCGYIGGAGADYGSGIAVDQNGNAYVAGGTNTTQQSFPVTVGPDLTFNGSFLLGGDAFVAKVNAAGTALAYCGYIGGASADWANAIAVDRAGNAYVTGDTCSDELTFPVLIGPDLTFNDVPTNLLGDVFLAKVNASGTALVYCGYIGGTSGERGFGIAVDAAGNAFVAGWTGSNELTFPVTVGPDLTCNGNHDVFVARVNTSGTALDYCGYIGGAQNDGGFGIAVDAAGDAYVFGHTCSDEQTFPVTGGPDLTFNGITDSFVACVSAGGRNLAYCGYIGGAYTEEPGWGIAVDAAGNAYVTAGTYSREQTFPVTVGPDLTFNGSAIFGGDAYVAKIARSDFMASGLPQIGSHVDFSLLATDDVGLPYQVGTSFGTGPIPIDTRQLRLNPDGLLVLSVAGAWPQVFEGYAGMIGQDGRAAARLHIPSIPALVGVHLHSAFVTLSAPSPSGIKTISGTESFMVAK